MVEIIVGRGIPGSGKSTWFENWAAGDPENRVRVNLDDIRYEKYGEYVLLDANGGLDRNREKEVMREARKRINDAIAARKSVGYDATNLGMTNFNAFTEASQIHKALTNEILPIRTQDFPIDFNEAMRRNNLRPPERKVPERVMLIMASRLGPKGEFRHIDGTYPVRPNFSRSERAQAVCFDMDGTLVDIRDVKHYLNHSPTAPKNFDAFQRYSVNSPPNPAVMAEMRAAHKAGYKIVITTARSEQYREISQKWLDENNVPYENMFMRARTDQRSDYEVKVEMMEERIKPMYDVVRCFDDNPQALQAWKELGLSVSVIPFIDKGNINEHEGRELPVSAPLFREGVCLRCDRKISKGVVGPTCAKLR